ncbi:ABC transporter ATP-binding protein [Paenibacillus ihuae]|uniref:ABC transporter ATP-binding protein n=1 Tax=Paenibacillus ihuae TaxID=1232431 RepID=UPI0006D574B0|nr:ATP-binding cassette domain-containing protein [Paenibacillus ihuae]
MAYHIQVKDLSKTYRVPVRKAGLRSAVHSLIRPQFSEVKAVDNVSFTIECGEMVGFIGPNGAGKTTTLKMLSGLLYPTSGEVTAAGFTPWQRKSQYLKKISMLMGNRSQLQWNNTVYDTMYIFKEIYGVSAEDFKKHLGELTEMFDVGDLMNKRARNLSLGERSKCEFMISLLHKPGILYLDEPTLGMDVTMQLRLRQYMKEYNQKYGTTVILTSHYMSDITSLCSRVLLINSGNLIYDGKLSSLTDKLTPFRIIRLTLEEENPPLCGDSLQTGGIPAELIESNGNEYTLRVNKEDAVKASAMLMSRYALIDFGIADPPVESVIDKIYAEGITV